MPMSVSNLPASPMQGPTRLTSIGYVERALETPLVHDLMRPHFHVQQESFLLLAFDTSDRLVRMEEAMGLSQQHCIIPQHLWRALLSPNVSRVVMAHNHPSGIAWPSSIDRQSTIRAVMMLDLLGISLQDHLIFVDHGHYSFRRAGLL